MKISLLIMLFLLESAFCESSITESDILREQLTKDIRVILSQAKKTLPIDESIHESIQSLLKLSSERLSISEIEKEKLELGGHLVSKENFLKKLKELRRIDAHIPFPTMLSYYERVELKNGLNPAQRILAFRIALDSIDKGRKRFKINKQLKANKSE